MGKHYRCVTTAERTTIEQLTLRGLSNGVIATQVGVKKSTVAHIAKRVRRNGNTVRPPRTGRPPLMDDRGSRRLLRIVRTGRYATLAELRTAYNAGSEQPLSLSTLRRRLRDAGIASRMPVVKPYVGPSNRRRRLQWARLRRGWADEWTSVVFTDESRFEVRGRRTHARVWRSKGEKWLPDCLSPSFKSGRESVMVWGGICSHGRTPLVLVDGSMTGPAYQEMLMFEVYPHLMRLYGSTEAFLFQEDMAPPHTARTSRQVREDLGLRCLAWVPQSPDMNCLENAWDYLERQVRAIEPPPKNREELFLALQQAWDAIPQSYIAGLVASMPRRLAAVIKGKGCPTKY